MNRIRPTRNRPFLAPLLLCVAGLPTIAAAATLTWPDVSAPCNTTLQACINGAAAGDTVEISAIAPTVTGDLTIAKPLTLTSGPAARGLLQNGTLTINASAAGLQTVNVSKLVLDEMRVIVLIGSNEPLDTQVVELSELLIRNVTSFAAIQATNVSTASQRQFTLRDSEFVGRSAFVVSSGSPMNGFEATLRRNVFRFTANAGFPINWANMGAGTRFNVTGNRFEQLGGGNAVVLYATASTSASGTGATLQVDRNVFVGGGTGLRVDAGATPLQARFRHNTLRYTTNGFLMVPTGSAGLDLRAGNNIFADVASPIVISAVPAPPHVLTQNRNLYANVTFTPFLGFEANAVLQDPRFIDAYNLRLQPTSPARDAADAADVIAFGTDHDGIVGVRSGAADIGAYEWDDGASFRIEANASNIAGNTVPLSLDLVQPGLGDLPIVQRVLPSGAIWLPGNGNNLGLYEISGQFELFTQDLSTFPASSLRLLRPGVGTGPRDLSFVHAAINQPGNPNNNVTANETRIPNASFPSSLGPASSLVPVVFQRWDPPGSSGTYNNHPVGVYFTGGSWRVFNQDIAAMPDGAGFHVIVPTVFADYAFKVSTRIPRSGIELDHPRLNNNPCAHVYLTSAFGDHLDPSLGADYIPSALMVQFNETPNGGGRWLALRADGNSFAAGSTLHVYVDPERSRECLEERPFRDGFE